MINPYESVNWETVYKVVSASHMHLTNQDAFDNAYQKGGIRHFPISNYYPSAPSYPLDAPLYPMKLTRIPEDVLGMPNAEHHSFTQNPYASTHLLALGSVLTSGKPIGEKPVGFNDTIDNFCCNVKKTMLFQKGGGVVIAHPKWSFLPVSRLVELLDAHDNIIGMEIYNATAADANKYAYERTLPSYDQWDEILSTGRYTLGFWVPDHRLEGKGDAPGKNILLAESYTEEACALAYGKGAFYGMMELTDSAFERIEASPNSLYVCVNERCDIKFISERGVYKKIQDATELSVDWTENEKPLFLRIKASRERGTIYSQPVQY